MRIKKIRNNEYILAGGVWVRNFTKPYAKPRAITSMIGSADHHIMMANESINLGAGHGNIAEEAGINFSNVVIISDGYAFSERHLELADLPPETFVIAVNGALRHWKLSPRDRSINAYVVNNPYPECLTFMPNKSSRYFPTCISSIRTYPEFNKKYMGNLYVYEPTPEREFGTKMRAEKYHIDDYRNPICAAVGLAYQFGVRRLMMMCCDDAFEDRRDAAEQLENGLWTYPQQITSHEIIDANLYWLTHDEQDEVVVASYSSGPKYKNATYISCKDEALAFFEEESMEEVNDATTIST